MPGIKLKLLNVRYSPNLGDGLLVDCLEWGCRLQLPQAQVSSVDLAGRTSYGEGRSARAALLTTLSAMPARVRRLAAGAVLKARVRLQLQSFYRRELQGADAVVLGGGNLFSDMDLNFPIKVEAALAVAAEARVPVWIYGCGVSGTWSSEGQSLFERAVGVSRLIDVFVRDTNSKQIWDQRLKRATGIKAKVIRDPGLLACRAYNAHRSTAQAPFRVGVGVIAPIAIRYHSENVHSSDSELTAWFEELIEGILESGYAVTLVTNGSPEDTEFGVALCKRLLERCPAAPLDFPEHETPRDLVQTLTRLSAFVGFRLHALICAHSLEVPTFALDWDCKVGAFMASIARADYVYDVTKHRPDIVLAATVAELASQALQATPSRDDGMGGISELCNSIRATID